MEIRAYNTATQLGGSAPQQAETTHILSRIGHAHEIVSALEGHVGASSETLWGPQPLMQPPDRAGPKAVVAGFLPQALEMLESLTQRLQALEQRAARLRSL